MGRFLSPLYTGRGFTIVELLLASTITVFIAAATVVTLRTTLAARTRIEHQDVLQAEARSALGSITTTLRNAYRGSGGQAVIEVAPDSLGGLPADRIRFFTVTHVPTRPGQPESDVRECEYSLMAREGDVAGSLMKRIDPTVNDEPDHGGVVERVAENILSLHFTCFTGTRWRQDWPESNTWPVAIRVELLVIDPEKPSQPQYGSRLVVFPYGHDSATGRTTEIQ